MLRFMLRMNAVCISEKTPWSQCGSKGKLREANDAYLMAGNVHDAWHEHFAPRIARDARFPMELLHLRKQDVFEHFVKSVYKGMTKIEAGELSRWFGVYDGNYHFDPLWNSKLKGRLWGQWEHGNDPLALLNRIEARVVEDESISAKQAEQRTKAAMDYANDQYIISVPLSKTNF